ncbi:MAG: methyl-accepting chemotaxis protein [Syntrophobacteraceae bacterium]
MMKKLSIGIGAKIFVGFIALIIIGVVIGVAGYFSLSRVTSAGSISDLSAGVQQKILEARILEKEYLLRKDEDSYNRLLKCLGELDAHAANLRSGMDQSSNFGEINEALQVYRQAMAEIKKLEEEDAKALKELQAVAGDITTMAKAESAKAASAVKEDILQRNSKALKEYALESIKNITAVGHDVLKYYHEKQMTKEEALEAVRTLHFAGDNYFFVVQEDLILVAHGSDRKLEGRDFGKIQDKKTGKTFMIDVVEGAIKSGESFTEYFWTKPGMGDAIFPKVTYAKHFKPWNLVICAGVYIEDIESQVAKTGKAFEEGINKLEQANGINTAMLEARIDALYFFSYGQKQEKVAEGISRLKQFAASNEGLRQKGDVYLDYFNRRVRNASARVQDVAKIDAAAEKTAKVAGGIGAYALNVFSDAASGGKKFISIFILIGVAIGFLIATLLARTIIRPIKHAIHGILETSEQVSSASAQVSSASHELAQGATHQAASIEETSSALEEMTSMTKQNAENAGHANELTKESRTIVGEANKTMEHLTASMSEISKASEETQKIVKTIDEIAFQTNLLALNAAVEAARAGEAGAGFAVVAEEVRNLAMRAAEAARNTAGMIESTVAKVKEGSALVEKTNLDFRKVASCVTKSEELVGEIAAASVEQAQGISQINGAIAQMDKVVQHNSANAEESAAASQQMNSQAGNLEGYLKDLVNLVGGDVAKNMKSNGKNGGQPPVADFQTITTASKPRQKTNGKKPPQAPKACDKSRANQVIPFDEGGMEEF